MSRAVIRTGLIGFGVAGRLFHAPFLRALDDYSLDIVVTSDAARAAEVERCHPGARVVPTPEDLFAAAADLDLVVVASPTGTHVRWAGAALGERLAVVVDKPFAVTAAEGRDLVETAERLDVPFTVFQNRRWDGDFLTVRRLVAEGALGEVHRFESRFEWWKPAPRKSWKLEATVKEGGGILYDLGAHVIDQALLLFGDVDPDDVHAEVLTRRPGGVADDDVFVALTHLSGVRSHLWMSGLAAQPGPRFRVLGAGGAYTKYGLDPQEQQLGSGMDPRAEGFGVEPPSARGSLGIGADARPVATAPGRYVDFYRGLADALLRDRPLPVEPGGPLRVLELIESIHERARG
jgi:scyllo-inositol 2-dehydrogenase (NADP+)